MKNVNKVVRRLSPVVVGFVISLGLCALTPTKYTPVAQSQIREDAASSDSIIRIGVLGLFHPREFQVSATAGQALVLQAGADRVVLEKTSGVPVATIQISDSKLVATAGRRVLSASTVLVTNRNGEATDFILSITGKITRRYHGTLEIKPSAGVLLAIVTLDQETAVASVVAAESAPDSPLEALKAQAVAVRSYFVAGRGRHHEFDFCDTTHCQFLRSAPSPSSAVGQAVAATRGMILAYDSQPFPALYTRSCGGRTLTPAEVGMPPARYPYYSVRCERCRLHPVRWTTRVSTSDAELLRKSGDSGRLSIDRRLGWSAVPGNDFTATRDGDQLILSGVGYGHGIGMCQSGAKAMAESGSNFREILSHYYPNTAIVSAPAGTLAEKRDSLRTQGRRIR